MIAAPLARLSAATSVRPSRDTARSRGHESGERFVGGKSCGIGANDGGGTGMTPARRAWPDLGLTLKTWITSPWRPGVPGDAFSSRCDESATPDTYAVLPPGANAMPPETPGIGIVWITLPVRRACLLRQRAPRRPCVWHATVGAASTIRMSLRPRPASSAHRKRPLGVRAPPPGWFPSGDIRPYGVRWRPLGWIRVVGPTALGAVAASAVAAMPSVTVASASGARSFTAPESFHAGLEPELPSEDLLHDLVGAAADRAQAQVARRALDAVLLHVARAAHDLDRVVGLAESVALRLELG